VPTVLVYGDDPAFRERIRLAAGRLPGGAALGPVDYLEADASGAVVRAVDAGGIDALVLDGEAWPAGGLGVCRQLKNEVESCPPILVVVAREADRWLGTWSMADAVLVTPLDPAEVAGTVARLLADAAARLPVPAPVRSGLLRRRSS
jgi:DNA-binding response OmpR family regulator